jgi:alpha-tubulin suppressor-like RCC1 family protein
MNRHPQLGRNPEWRFEQRMINPKGGTMRSNPVGITAASIILVVFSSACKAIMPETPAPLAVTRIAAGGNQTCILDKGKAKCWGENDAGQLGDGTFENRTTPEDMTVLADEITFISMGYKQTCVLTAGGDVLCWGGGWTGRLEAAQAGGAYRAVAAGDFHTCVVTSAGGAQCWGGNALAGMDSGMGGDAAAPADVAGLTEGIEGISAGVEFFCAIQKGATKCWGSNDIGQLGDGSFVSSQVPRDVVGLNSGIKFIDADVFHACALTAGGDVWCWGENLSGELGDGTNQSSPLPVKVAGLEADIQAIAVGGSHTCALTKAGGVMCWGGNAGGQLGDGTTADRTSPVEVAGLSSGAVAIAAGSSHTCAMLADGSVKCWGTNAQGQLGNGANTDSSTPVSVVFPAA